MKQYKLKSDMSATEYNKKINEHKDVIIKACCDHLNGECVDFAKNGTCRAFNMLKGKEVMINEAYNHH